MIASGIRQCWLSKVAVESFLNIIIPDEVEMDEIVSLPQVRASFEQQTMATKSFIIIQTCAFLDEYKFIYSLKPDDVSLNDDAVKFKEGLKIILGHAVKFINSSWKDIYAVRNNLLAHNWRSNGKLIMFSNLIDHPQNVPWIDEEFTLLVGIFDAIIEIMKEYRPDFFEEMNLFISEKSKKKVHHMTRSESHEKSIEIVNAMKGLMKLELDHFNGEIIF